MAGYQALYRAWRPEKFADVYGQNSVTETLRHQIVSGHIAHAYLFCGSRGTGKTSTAKILARAINCLTPVDGEPCGKCAACEQLKNESSLDVLEIDAASNNGVDEVRVLRDRISYPPTVGRYKVYIIDEVHMLSTGAFNALLKTLEEPPAHAVFILATTEPQKLLATVTSRCQRYDFRRISVKNLIARMEEVLRGIGRECESAALESIAVSADGGMRDALSLLDMCLSYTDGIVTDKLVREVLGSSGRDFMFEFTDALERRDAGTAMKLIDTAMRDGRDARSFGSEVAAHLRIIMMSQMMGDELTDIAEITAEAAERFRAQGEMFESTRLVRVMDMFINLDGSLKYAAQPRAVLEMCAVRACRLSKEKGVEGLTERIEALEKQLKEGVVVKAAPASAAKSAPASARAAQEETSEPAEEAPESGPDREVFARAMEAYATENPSRKVFLGQLKFLRREDNVIHVSYDRKLRLQAQILQGKTEEIEACLSNAFGTPMRINMMETGVKKAATGASAEHLTRVFETFGRENVNVEE